MGWGRDEINDYYYWGGHFDIQEFLNEQGFNVHTLSVGPVSSNYDRAIEVFYQIKGGQVDYGKNHSEKYNLIQKPESKHYKGIYPEWDNEHPIHIIGHSQGGQTARMLDLLLEMQEEGEKNILKKNYTGWIKSITTISTPHNGTTLVPIIDNIFPFAQTMIIWINAIGQSKNIEQFYNFDLQHWGLYKKNNESIRNYINRIKNSPISKTKNFCKWDLSIEGSIEFNKICTTNDSTYYYSYSTSTNINEKNEIDIRLKYKLQSILIKRAGEYPEEWKENDGIVNTISMPGPQNETIMIYNGKSISGKWQNMGKIYLDHLEVIGHYTDNNSYEMIKKLFINHCNILYSL